MSKEEPPSAAISWLSLAFEGRDGYLGTEVEYVALFLELLANTGIDSEQILIAGVDAYPVERAGTFGDRLTTFAASVDELMRAAKDIDTYGSSYREYPLRYADEPLGLPDEPRQPAIVVLDANAFVPAAIDETTDGVVLGDGDTNWQLKLGISMDMAVLAVVKVDTPSFGRL